MRLLAGFDGYLVCFSPDSLVVRWQAYRVLTSVVVHVDVLHLVFNMAALAPTGSDLERALGSVRFTNALLLFCGTNAAVHTVLAYAGSLVPLPSPLELPYECSAGFSGVLFALIVVEGRLSGFQSRRYPWALLVVFQLMLRDVSLLGHLSGILSGLALCQLHHLHRFRLASSLASSSSHPLQLDSRGLLKSALLSPESVSWFESSRILEPLVRRPSFIVGGTTAMAGPLPSTGAEAALPTLSSWSTPPVLQEAWRRAGSWLGQAHTVPSHPAAPAEATDPKFPGTGHVLGAQPSANLPPVDGGGAGRSRLLKENTGSRTNDSGGGTDVHNGKPLPAMLSADLLARQQQQYQPPRLPQPGLELGAQVKQLAAMGFNEDASRSALTAANGDVALAIEYLSSN
eukprot:SM000318S12230  [mRNA]  locus=s318:32784:35697:- [translate_table: standard]